MTSMVAPASAVKGIGASFAPLPKGEMKAAALRYAAAGFKVFPCHGITAEGRCGCGNPACPPKSWGKHPVTANGLDDATADERQIGRWWDQHPHANIGFACAANDVVALDVDPRNGGDTTLAALEAEHGTVASYVEAVTGGDGRHLMFKAPHGVTVPGKAGAGLDLKWRGYILVEPSLHASGRRYAWKLDHDPRADEALGGVLAPACPKFLLGGARKEQEKGASSSHYTMPAARVRAMLWAIPNDDSGDETTVTPDHELWFKIMQAAHAATGGGLVGLGLFLEWSEQHSTHMSQGETEARAEARIAARWRSLNATKEGGITAATLEAEARRHGYDGLAWDAVEDPDDESEIEVPQVDAPAEPPKPARLKAQGRSFAELRALALPPVPYVVDGLLVQGEVAAAPGAPGAGKTTDLFHLGLAVAEGTPWHGLETTQGGVLWVGSEAYGEDVLRLLANAKRHGRGADLPFRHEPKLCNLYTPAGTAAPDEKWITDRAKAMRADTGHRCRLIVVENLRHLVSPGNTSDEGQIMLVMRALNRIAEKTGATVIVIHHTVRDGSRYAGSGAIESAADSVWLYTGKTCRDAKGKDVSRDHGTITFPKLRRGDRKRVVRYDIATEHVVDDAKGNPVWTAVAVDYAPRDEEGPNPGDVSKEPGGSDDAPGAPAEAFKAADEDGGETAKRKRLLLDVVAGLLIQAPKGCTARAMDDAFNAKRRKAGGVKAALGESTLRALRSDMIEAGEIVNSGSPTRPLFILPTGAESGV